MVNYFATVKDSCIYPTMMQAKGQKCVNNKRNILSMKNFLDRNKIKRDIICIYIYNNVWTCEYEFVRLFDEELFPSILRTAGLK